MDGEGLQTLLLLWIRGMVALALLPFDLVGLGLRGSAALALAFYSWDHAPGFSLVAGLHVVASGLGLAFALAVPVHAAAMCGEVFDSARGQTIGAMYDPLWNSGESLTGALGKWVAWAILVVSGSLEKLFYAFRVSLQTIGEQQDWQTLTLAWLDLSLSGPLTATAFILPCLLFFLFLDLWGGCVATQVAPNGSITSEVFLLKAAAACLVLIGLGQAGPRLAHLLIPAALRAETYGGG